MSYHLILSGILHQTESFIPENCGKTFSGTRSTTLVLTGFDDFSRIPVILKRFLHKSCYRKISHFYSEIRFLANSKVVPLLKPNNSCADVTSHFCEKFWKCGLPGVSYHWLTTKLIFRPKLTKKMKSGHHSIPWHNESGKLPASTENMSYHAES
jgi:hypothetical protein